MTRTERSIPLHLLRLYPSDGLNRKIKPAWWKHLATTFNVEIMPRLAVLLDASGIYWIIDGQHRYLAMKSLGMSDWDVPCYVYENATDEDAAWIIGVLNDFRDPGVGNKFKWRLLQGDEQTRDIVEIADRAGWGIASISTGGRINAITPLYRLHNADVLTMTLTTLRAAFGNDNDAVQAQMLSGVGKFLTLHATEVDMVRFVRKLGRYDPDAWTRKARTNRDRQAGINTLGDGLYLALRDEWNVRVRNKL
jgi:hypothetical protein